MIAAPAQAGPGDGLAGLLAAPSVLQELLRQSKGTSYVEADLYKDGIDYEAGLPYSNISENGSSITFISGWAPGDSIALLSYAMFLFQAPGYDRDPQVRLDFGPGASDPGELYLGLAEWDKDCWRWFKNPQQVLSEYRFNLANLAPYFDPGGDLLAVVVSTAYTNPVLKSIRLGPKPPVPDITADPVVGSVPFEVNLDASGSTTPEGTITKYEWDFYGDETFLYDTGTTPTISHEYTSNGTCRPAVRVTNSLGVSAVSTVTVYAVGSWTHTWGREENDSIRSITHDGAGFIYGVGSSVKPSDPSNTDLLLMKWSPAGEVVWAQTFNSGVTELGADLKFNDNGELVAVGSVGAAGDSDMLVSKWSPDGNLVWMRSLGGAANDGALYVETDGTDIYVGGYTTSTTPAAEVCLVKILDDGTVDWQMAYGHGETDLLRSLTVRKSMFAGTTGLIAGVEYVKNLAIPHICKLEVGLDGAVLGSANLYLEANNMEDPQILRTTSLTDTFYYTAGIVDSSKVFLSKTDAAGNNVYCTLITPPAIDSIQDMEIDSTGKIVVCGYGDLLGSSIDALMFQFEPDDGSFVTYKALGHPTYDCWGLGLLAYYGGFLLCGSAGDASANEFASSFSEESASWDYTSIIINSAAVDWSANPLTGNLADITSTGTLDTGGGESDSLLMHRLSL